MGVRPFSYGYWTGGRARGRGKSVRLAAAFGGGPIGAAWCWVGDVKGVSRGGLGRVVAIAELLLEGGGYIVGGGSLMGEEGGGNAAEVGGGVGSSGADVGLIIELEESGSGGDEVDEIAVVGVWGDVTLGICGGDCEDFREGGGEDVEVGGLIAGGGDDQDAGLAEGVYRFLEEEAGAFASEAEVDDIGALISGGEQPIDDVEGGGDGLRTVDIDGKNPDAGAGGVGRGEGQRLEEGFGHGGSVRERIGGAGAGGGDG